MDDKNGIIGLNKITIFIVLIYFLCGVGASYAYFAFNYENTSTVVGNVVNIDADLKVERIVGTNEKLVPMMDAALSNAINGIGSSNGACIDSLGNLSCQVYKITLTNNASRLQHLVGSIELYPKKGTGNAYSNLKWQELTSVTSIKSGSIVNGMNKSILVSGLTMESKETKTWYVGVWLSEIDSNQQNIDKGEFQGTVTFEVINSITEGVVGSFYNDFAEKVMISNAQSDVSIDFKKTSEQTSTNGIYVRNNTINDPYSIYYYRGNVNNNLIFAGFCWKVVRTTETGGLKLIYNGAPTNGTCDNIGTSSQIGTKAFNSNHKSLAYAGYMYGDVYTYETKDLSNDITEYAYSHDISYENGTYTLIGEITSGEWSDLYNEGLNNYYYTCFSKSTTCTSVKYIYYADSSTAYYITLNGEISIDEAISNMLDKNITSSTIKGDEQTEGTLDYWYYTNIEQKGYKNYIEDTVWCNDRSIYQRNGWDPNSGNKNKYLFFIAYNRMYITYTPDITCAREIDKFTVSKHNGNGDLIYPVGLLTADEIMLAGANHISANSSYYLYTGENYWSNSPITSYSVAFYVSSSGTLDDNSVNNNTYGVRPSISLKHGFIIIDNGANGTSEKPYVVE